MSAPDLGRAYTTTSEHRLECRWLFSGKMNSPCTPFSPETSGLAEALGALQCPSSPKEALKVVKKFIGNKEIKIGVTDSKVMFKTKNEIIITNLLEGAFPNINPIIERTNQQSFQVNRVEFMQVLKRMAIMTSDTYKGVIFEFGQNELNLKGVSK